MGATSFGPRIWLNSAQMLTGVVAVSMKPSDTSDGTCIRDYIHVCDLADAHVLAMADLLSGGNTSALNLGAGRGVSVAEVIASAERVTQQRIRKVMGPRRPGDPAHLVADPTRARARLGWTAHRSDLESILADAWAWHRHRFGRRLKIAALEP